MPIYEYTCPTCRIEFEELVLKSDQAVQCPKCGSQDTHKLMSRCRSQVSGAQELGSSGLSGSGCSSCGGGSCATCG